MIKDYQARQQAIDPSASFIVQAPAGSGKTELLTQRFLALLARVQHPEEIIALTFTRKAANEMRARIIHALHFAQTQPMPEAEHQRATWTLAQAALKCDVEYDWQLIANPQRLRIQTIDALCANLAKQMPITSQFGSLPQICDHPQRLYRQAAETLLASLAQETPWQQALQQCLLHVDNQYEKLADLFCNCLAIRDQWLPHVLAAKSQDDLRETLECSLQNVFLDACETITDLLDEESQQELLLLAQFAGSNLEAEHPLFNWCHQSEFPDVTIEHEALWRTLPTLLLSKQLSWRKQVNKNTGFPAPSAALSADDKAGFKMMKQRMQTLLEQFTQDDALLASLQDVALAPPLAYSEQQWDIVESLLQLLPILVAELSVCFGQQQQIDFTGIASNSLLALGSIDNPSELALRLDYQIKHLLVDEFQDTSYSQFHLLEKLTAGWESGDGRTLFVVGDPMQSIYRFRQAEVSLFLRAQQFGIGDIALIPLYLTSNFRSSATMIEWVNTTFLRLFPNEDVMSMGAVRYSMADPIHPSLPEAGAFYTLAEDKATECQAIVNCVQQKLAQGAGSIAILVKARHHLHDTLRLLQQHRIEAQAVELDTLYQRPWVQDAWSLTKALLHRGDRLAWFSILRSPLVGLSLAELNDLSHSSLTVWQQCQQLAESSPRLHHAVHVIQAAYADQYRLSLRDWIEQTWQRLGGLSICQNDTERQDCDTFFAFLESVPNIDNMADVEQRLQQLLASSYEDARVQVMTIHKSKGLEFDTVILPSLEQAGSVYSPQLLLWAEHTNRHGENSILLAPMKASDMDNDPIYQYLKRDDKQRQAFENTRLLYVAITRAKTACYCFATGSDEETYSPRSGSFLAELWPLYAREFQQQFIASLATDHSTEHRSVALKRLPETWYQTHAFTYPALEPRPNPIQESIDPQSRLWGTFIHSLLQQLHDIPVSEWSLDALYQHTWIQQLRQAGMPGYALKASVERAQATMQRVFTCERARWLFDPNHQQAQAEYALSVSFNERVQHIVIDRTFIDAEQTRWIIDFKTSQGDIDSERDRYQQQLSTYAQALRMQGEKSIQCALYFPRNGNWVAWEIGA